MFFLNLLTNIHKAGRLFLQVKILRYVVHVIIYFDMDKYGNFQIFHCISIHRINFDIFVTVLTF